MLGVAEGVEKGFVEVESDVDVENGFADDELAEGFTPNKLSPIFVEAVVLFCVLDAFVLGSGSFFSFRPSFAEISEILTPRSARMLPSLRLHVFRRQVSTYNRLSGPGNCSGRSPFNCNSRTIRSLHTLHRARVADGGMVGSSQVF